MRSRHSPRSPSPYLHRRPNRGVVVGPHDRRGSKTPWEWPHHLRTQQLWDRYHRATWHRRRYSTCSWSTGLWSTGLRRMGRRTLSPWTSVRHHPRHHVLRRLNRGPSRCRSPRCRIPLRHNPLRHNPLPHNHFHRSTAHHNIRRRRTPRRRSPIPLRLFRATPSPFRRHRPRRLLPPTNHHRRGPDTVHPLTKPPHRHPHNTFPGNTRRPSMPRRHRTPLRHHMPRGLHLRIHRIRCARRPRYRRWTRRTSVIAEAKPHKPVGAAPCSRCPRDTSIPASRERPGGVNS